MSQKSEHFRHCEICDLDIIPKQFHAHLRTLSHKKKAKMSEENENFEIFKHCEICDLEIIPKQFHAHLRTLSHKKKAFEFFSSEVQIMKSAFEKRIVLFRIKPSENYSVIIEPDVFLDKIKSKFIMCIKYGLKEHDNIKCNFELYGAFYKPICKLIFIEN